MDRSDRTRLWIEVISALGVIATLGFVAWELRQNTNEATLNRRAVEVAAYQDLISQITDQNRVAIENDDFADVQMRFYADRGTLTPRELNQMNSYLWMLFRHGDMAFYEYDRGVLSRDRLESALAPLISRFEADWMHEAWERRRGSFTSAYQRFIDSVVVASSPDADQSAIRALRAESNAAIAAHDVPGILASMRLDVRVAGSSGRFLDGHDAVAEAFATQFADFDDALYVRTTESVRLAASGETAAELGNWVGSWTTGSGSRRFGGQYSAYWWKTDGEWRIHSELFVPLFCEGADCE